jgi:hypothetical protein
MFNVSRREREQPMRLVALVGAVWLVTVSGLLGYARSAPEPASAIAAIHEVPAQLAPAREDPHAQLD